MRILVTGASGFVARHLIEELSGGEVWGTARSHDTPSWLASDRYRPADLAHGDLHSIVAEARAQIVYHLGAQASVARSWDDPFGTLEANVIGTGRLLDAVAAITPAATVIVAGSGDVYGLQNEQPIPETAPLRPQSPYAASKAGVEALASAYARGAGLRVVGTRSFAQLGPGQRRGFALADWAAQVALAERHGGGRLEAGNLEVVRDYLHVRDAVRAYAALAEQGEPGALVNVCSGTGTRLRDLLDVLVGHAKVEIEVVQTRFRPADLPVLVGDNSLLRSLGWKPEHDIADGLLAILEEQRAIVERY